VPAPTLSSSFPSAGAQAVAIDSNIALTFSENIRFDDPGYITITKASDSTIFARIKLPDGQATINGNILTINPTRNLDYSTTYYLSIDDDVLQDFDGDITFNFTTASKPTPSPSGSSGSLGESAPAAAAPPDSRIDTTPRDPAPGAAYVQPTDADGDGLREVVTAGDSSTVDGNRDGIADAEQATVTGLRLINDGARGSDYGALVVNPGVQLRGVTLITPSSDGSIPVASRGGATVPTKVPDGLTNAWAGVMSFTISGITPGSTPQASISWPEGLAADSGNAYLSFNYVTNRFEEYVDPFGNPLYALIDSNDDGVFDSVSLALMDGDPKWDGDGQANGSVVDSGFFAAGERNASGSRLRDALTGNVLANTLNGKKGNDWLQGGLGSDILVGGDGKDRYIYTEAADSAVEQRDTVKVGKEDRFVFSNFDGDSVTEGQQKLVFIGTKAFSGEAGELRTTRSALEADLNGDSLADFVINLRGNMLMTGSNLVL
jgi:Ca2+-binding RTX toxin-like protein